MSEEKITIKDLIKAIKINGFFGIRKCSMCGYQLGYLFKDNVLHLDTGCFCVKTNSTKPRKESDLYTYLNSDHYSEMIKKFIEKSKKKKEYKIIRTQEEIVNHIEKLKKDKFQDMFGFQCKDLVDYLEFENAKIYLNEDYIKSVENKKKKWKKQTNTLKEIKDYMKFAWGKANNFRGLSADRSIQHLMAWTWLIDDRLYHLLKSSYMDSYKFYGKPQLELVCKYLKIDYSKLDDGVRVNSEEEIEEQPKQ